MNSIFSPILQDFRLGVTVSEASFGGTNSGCLPLLAGSLSGVPMRPEDMDQLMEAMNQERIEYVIPDDSENGDETIKEIKKLVEGSR